MKITCSSLKIYKKTKFFINIPKNILIHILPHTLQYMGKQLWHFPVNNFYFKIEINNGKLLMQERII